MGRLVNADALVTTGQGLILITDKHQTEPVGVQEIVDRYNYSLDHYSNIIPLQGHSGRHTNAYHEFITTAIEALDAIANENLEMFIAGMEMLDEFIKEYWWIPYARKKRTG